MHGPLNVKYTIITPVTHTIQQNTEHQKRMISYGLKSLKSSEHMHIYKEPGQSVHYKLYLILTILEKIWYAFSNIIKRYIRHNKHSMPHYNGILKFVNANRLLKFIFKTCSPCF